MKLHIKESVNPYKVFTFRYIEQKYAKYVYIYPT